MKFISSFLGICLLVCNFLTFTSCTKEAIVKTDSLLTHHDTLIIRHDSIIYRQDVMKFFPKKWYLQSHEIETYQSGVVTEKRAENFVANNYYNEFKSNGTYTNFDRGGITNGTWALVDDNIYVLDRNTTNERYYYIFSISATALINRGPFTKTNQLYTNFLFTAYFKSTQ